MSDSHIIIIEIALNVIKRASKATRKPLQTMQLEKYKFISLKIEYAKI